MALAVHVKIGTTIKRKWNFKKRRLFYQDVRKNLVFLKLDVVAKSFSYYYGVVDFHRRGSDFIRIPDLARTASCWDSLNGIVSSALPYQTLEKNTLDS